MIWNICLAIAVALLIRASVIIINKAFGRFRIGKALIYTLVATYVIYIPIFIQDYTFVGAYIGNLINVAQVIMLESSYLDGYQIIREGIEIEAVFQLYLLILGIIHCVLPIISGMTAYTFIVYCMSNLKLQIVNLKKSNVYIFSEINEKSIFLANDIFEHCGDKADFIFMGKNENKEEYNTYFERMNYFFFPGEIEMVELKRLRERKIYFFNIAQNENENLNNTIQLIEKYGVASIEEQRNIHIFIFSNIEEVETMIDSLEKGILNIQIVNEAQMCSYSLFDEFPLYQGVVNSTINLLIVGLTEIGLELLKTAVWIGQIEGVALNIKVIDEKAEFKQKCIALDLPELLSGDYHIEFFSVNLHEKQFEKIIKNRCAETTYGIICTDKDEENLKIGMFLRRVFLSHDGKFKNSPVLAVLINDFEKTLMVESLSTAETNAARKVSYDLIPFGGTRSICSYSNLIESKIEGLAKNIHLSYEEIFNEGRPIDVGASLERYNQLEVNKKSNKANALQIKYKLWLLGLDYVEMECATQEAEENLEEYLSEEYLERLVVVEHDRWMAFLRAEGWKGASVEEVEKYIAEGLSKGKHNCNLLKMHPYICPFGEISAKSEAFHLQDATIYDRELIKRIPDILHDKWNVTGRKYKIVKLEQNLKNGINNL